MTAQFDDIVRYLHKPRAIAGISGSGLFDPSQQHVKAVSWSSACTRGFYCRYEVVDGALLLMQVNLGLSTEDCGTATRGMAPKLFGKVPRRYTQHGKWTSWPGLEVTTSRESSDFLVDDLRELVPFTGGLLLGDEFIGGMYVHMGFHPAYAYRMVHELLFEAGKLTEEHDRSAQVAELREKLGDQPPWPRNGLYPEGLAQWIEQRFSRVYRGFHA